MDTMIYFQALVALGHSNLYRVSCTDVLTCLILFSVPCVPGTYKLAGIFRVSVDGRQDVLTEDKETYAQH